MSHIETGDHYEVRESAMPASLKFGKYYWRVFGKDMHDFLEGDYCTTFDCAVRAARNFIRHNQNKVYGSNSQPTTD